jgi:hypothetical protein
VSKCNLVKADLCIIYGTDFSVDDCMQFLLCVGMGYSKCTALELDYLGLMSRSHSVRSKVKYPGGVLIFSVWVFHTKIEALD